MPTTVPPSSLIVIMIMDNKTSPTCTNLHQHPQSSLLPYNTTLPSPILPHLPETYRIKISKRPFHQQRAASYISPPLYSTRN